MNHDRITLGHGSGGALSAELLREVVFPAFPDVQPTDGATVEIPGGAHLVMTTDSFVVKPLFFQGGDIGVLAVNGTVNDLTMMGAKPAYLSCALIIEEGFALADLGRICASMREAAGAAEIKIVTGDTKVVGHGEADGIFINTAGVGFASPALRFHPSLAAPGDALIVNGGLGEHGVTVIAARLGVSFDPALPSDTRPLWPQVSALLAAGIVPRVMRDITRGGLGSVACELVQGLPLDFHLEEAAVPVDPRVSKACDIWGFDYLHVASEGRFLAVVPAGEAARAAGLLGSGAAIVGRVETGSGRVVLHTAAGGRRLVKPLPAELLPRIC